MTRIDKTKMKARDGIIGPTPSTELAPKAKKKAKRGFQPTKKARVTKKND